MKNIFIAVLLTAFSAIAFGQAKKPTIMVMPSDVWCQKNGFMTVYDNQGTQQSVPDYKKALQNDPDLLLVIAKINTMMTDRGFPLKNLESVIKNNENQAAQDNMRTSKAGSALAESPLDKLKKAARADIIMYLTYTINQTGPKKSVTFNLQGIDAYTGKQIAGAQGTGQPSFSAELPVLLEEAVIAHLDNFNAQLQKHFDDLFANGREITVRVQMWDNGSGTDMETEYGGKELNEILDEWMAANTVKGRYSKSESSENYMFFEQVRIPLFNESGKSQDAKDFVQLLRKFLKDPPYSLSCKADMNGLGAGLLYIGEK
ncbi:MAG: DUF6175 family protein [Bacteroidota bacterium]